MSGDVGGPEDRPDDHRDERRDEAIAQVRGSSLLLVGRLIALALGLAVQVLAVRHLSREGYGVFAYALSIATVAENLALFGFDRGVSRFVPIYDERGEHARTAGLVVVVVSTVLGLGVAMFVVVAGLQDLFVGGLGPRPGAGTVLAILIVLAPLQALDRLFTSLLAIFAGARAIFLRKYVLGPGLRLLAVLAVIVVDGGPVALSVGYVVGGVIGVLVYVAVLARVVRAHPGFGSLRWGDLDFPLREVSRFTVPLLTTDLVFASMTAIDGVMVGQFHGPDEVAAIRSVEPVARLNQVVLHSFGILFTPLAARLFARGDGPAINDLYWRFTTWVTVLTVPVVLLTLALSEPITVVLFGGEYRDAAPLLAVLSFGYFVHAALGSNGVTLNVYDQVGYVVAINLVAGAANIALNLTLIPAHGAMGAAVATAATMALHNLLKQVGLARRTDVRGVDRRFAAPFVAVLVALVAVTAVSVLTPATAVVRGGVALAASLGVVGLARRTLSFAETFPELARLPVVGWLLGAPRDPGDSL